MTTRKRILSLLQKAMAATCIAVVFSQAVFSATFTVMYTTDGSDSSPGDGTCTDGEGCTLRAAIEEANALAGTDTIRFGMNLAIMPGSTYNIDSQVTIDGTTGGNTVTVDGSNGAFSGFTLQDDSDGTVIGGLYVYDYDGYAFEIQNGARNISIGNAALGGNVVGLINDGITVDSTNGIYVGGTEVSIERNTISGNANGITIGSTAKDVQILGNKIGTDVGGTLDKGNTGDGITISDGASLDGGDGGIEGVVIGTGGGVGYYNVIAGNGGDGIHIGSGASEINGTVKIQGNYIGLTSDGAAMGNDDEGIIAELSATGVDYIIGTDGDGSSDSTEGNYIGSNASRGIYIFEGDDVVIAGNKIGLNSSNADRGNGGLGVNIGTISAGPNTVRIGSDNKDEYERNVIGFNDAGGININNATTLNIHGNYIGLAADGATAAANSGAGISVGGVGGGGQITTLNIGQGGADNDGRNFIANGASGGYGAIVVENVNAGATIKIMGNILGLAANLQTAAVNTTNGIYILAAATTIIGTDSNGTDDAYEGNYIANSNGAGIAIMDGATAVTIAGNILGLATTGGFGTEASISAPNGQFGAPGTISNILIDSNSLTSLTIGGSSSAARNVIANAPEHGIYISDAGNAIDYTIRGNYIGLGTDGSSSSANSNAGIRIEDGGTITLTDNVVANSGQIGVSVGAGTGLTMTGNKIGTGADGVTAAGNMRLGLYVAASSMTTVNLGTTDANPNIIAANRSSGGYDGTGAYIYDVAATATITVANNYIGISSDGVTSSGLGNEGHGVRVSDGVTVTVGGNNNFGTDGTGSLGYGNVISNNALSGILIDGSTLTTANVYGNIIGAKKSSVSSAYNSADGNGTSTTGNIAGINISGSALTTVNVGQGEDSGNGITATSRRNLVVGTENGKPGIALAGSASGATINVVNNFVGLDWSGNVDLGNGGVGIALQQTVKGTVNIGGTGTYDGNYISGNGDAGIKFTNSNGLTANIRGNTIGLNAGGTSALANDSSGIVVNIATNSGTQITVGGSTSAARNVISGNSKAGVEIAAASVTIMGNYIGTNSTGTAAIGNGATALTSTFNNGGILITGGNATIGTDENGSNDSSEGNVISGNYGHGIVVFAASSIAIGGNKIGTNASESAAVPNQAGTATYDLFGDGNTAFNGSGIIFYDVATGGLDSISDAIIGGETENGANVIAGNAGYGIVVGHVASGGGTGQDFTGGGIMNNYIGTSSTGSATLSGGSSAANGTTPASTNEVYVGAGSTTTAITNFSLGSLTASLKNTINNTSHVGVKFSNITDSNFASTSVDFDNISAMNSWTSPGTPTLAGRGVFMAAKLGKRLVAVSGSSDLNLYRRVRRTADLPTYHYWEKWLSGSMVDYRPKAACEDGSDNDGDGRTDYPADTGCTSATEDDETGDPSSGGGAVTATTSSSSGSSSRSTDSTRGDFTNVSRTEETSTETTRETTEETPAEAPEDRAEETAPTIETTTESKPSTTLPTPSRTKTFVTQQRITKAINTVSDTVTQTSRINYEILVEPEVGTNANVAGEEKSTDASEEIEKLEERTSEQTYIVETSEKILADPLNADKEEVQRFVEVVEGNLKRDLTKSLKKLEERGETPVQTIRVGRETLQIDQDTEIEFTLDQTEAEGRSSVAKKRGENVAVVGPSTPLDPGRKVAAIVAVTNGGSPFDPLLADKIWHGGVSNVSNSSTRIEDILPAQPRIPNLTGDRMNVGRKPLVAISSNKVGEELDVFVVDKNGSREADDWKVIEAGKVVVDEGYRAAVAPDLVELGVDFRNGAKEVEIVVQNKEGKGSRVKVVANPRLEVKAEKLILSRGEIIDVAATDVLEEGVAGKPEEDRVSYNWRKSLYTTTLLASAAVVEEETGVNAVEPAVRRVLSGYAQPGSTVFVTWKSVVLNSVVIADASQGYFEVEMPEELEEGDHEVLVYTYTKSRNVVSDVTSLLFGKKSI